MSLTAFAGARNRAGGYRITYLDRCFNAAGHIAAHIAPISVPGVEVPHPFDAKIEDDG